MKKLNPHKILKYKKPCNLELILFSNYKNTSKDQNHTEYNKPANTFIKEKPAPEER